MSGVKAVIFDWAGTMIDFGSRAPVAAMANVFAAAGAPVSEALIRRYMGYAKREHVAAILSEPEMAECWRQAKRRDWNWEDVDALMAALEPAMRRSAADHATLVPGAVETVRHLRDKAVKIGSTTGYTRTMMADIIPAAARQGYEPDVIVCAGETAQGRPAPLMIWKALSALAAWPAPECVKVDDAPVGVEAGRNAGLWTVGVAASGNGVGVSRDDYEKLPAPVKAASLNKVASAFSEAGADYVIESVAGLPVVVQAIEERIVNGDAPSRTSTQVFL